MRGLPIGLFLFLGLSCGTGASQPERTYRGACDASAAVLLDARSLAVADDEDNVLRIYDVEAGGAPRFAIDVSAFLGLEPDEESDIEAAARVGDRIYWITSHGRNRRGVERRARERFFATEIVRANGRPSLRPIGRPFRDLVPALVQALEPRGVDLAAAAGIDAVGRVVEKDPRLAPKVAGLNIEALAAAPDGGIVYIGFRNPLLERDGGKHAIVVPLLNPAAVIERGARPDLGAPLFWNLAGHGLRSMLWSPAYGSFFLVSGAPGGGTDWRLYRWSGDPKTAPSMVTTSEGEVFEGQPEALVEGSAARRLLALSDDGDLRIRVRSAAECKPRAYRPDGTCRNKDLAQSGSKTFRGFEIAP